MQGFRKVDPGRWQFAHASFLRGQTHPLVHVVRRNSGCGKEEEDEERVTAELVRLIQEQRRVEERVERMWRRVQEIEADAGFTGQHGWGLQAAQRDRGTGEASSVSIGRRREDGGDQTEMVLGVHFTFASECIFPDILDLKNLY